MLYFIGLIFLAATSLLLGVGSIDTLTRSQKELWDLGHIAYFFIAIYLVGHLPQLKNVPLRKLVPGLAIFALVMGGLIELSQFVMDRTPDVQDLVRDLTGALLALAFFARYNKWLKLGKKISFKIVMLVLLAIQSIPFIKATTDEIIASLQFPVLVSNDTPFELDRWQGNAHIEIKPLESVNLLELQLSPGHQYPGTSLLYFPGDWNGYELLVIRLFNPSSGALEINIKVHDRAHEKAYRNRDRFNLSTQVKPGWSDLEIRLNEIKNAPRGRKMNMREISNLSVFTSKLAKQRILYIDKIYLSR